MDGFHMRTMLAQKITIGELCSLAMGLKTEDGSNPEYDRALVELITDAMGLPMEAKDEIAEYLGIELHEEPHSDKCWCSKEVAR